MLTAYRRAGEMGMKNGQKFFGPIFVVVWLFLTPNILFADVTGSILGVVRDQSQAVVRGARITVTNTQTNLSEHTISAEDGSYRFLALPVGDLQTKRDEHWLRAVQYDGHRGKGQ